MVGGVPDVITCAKFQIEIFMGYDFTGGRIFDFPIDFSMGLTTVQRYCAACDENIFAVLYVTLLWALHIVTKQQFFTFIFAVFPLNSTLHV